MKTFVCLYLLISLHTGAIAQQVDAVIQKNGVLFTEVKDSILFYQTANKSLHGSYTRSNYIHPLYGLDGQVVTEDFPDDHPHHRGIFWAWHQLYVGEKRIGDGWEIKDLHWEVVSVKKIEMSEVAKIQAEVHWKSPLWVDARGNEKPLVTETTTLTVYPAREKYRQVDVEIALLAMEQNMRIGGSEDHKGYGGFSARIKLPHDLVFTSSAGPVTPTSLPVEPAKWMDFSGSLGANDSLAGITILGHPANPGHPTPWILRAKESIQNAVYPHPGAQAVPLSATTALVLRYRLLVHRGDASAVDIKAIYEEDGK